MQVGGFQMAAIYGPPRTVGLMRSNQHVFGTEAPCSAITQSLRGAGGRGGAWTLRQNTQAMNPSAGLDSNRSQLDVSHLAVLKKDNDVGDMRKM